MLYGWLNRSHTANRDAIKISVGYRQSVRMKTKDTQHWSLAKVFRQVKAGPQHFLGFHALSFGKRSKPLRVRLNEWDRDLFVQLTQALFTRGVFNHNDPPGLAIAAGWRPGCCFQHATEHVIRNRVRTEPPHCP